MTIICSAEDFLNGQFPDIRSWDVTRRIGEVRPTEAMRALWSDETGATSVFAIHGPGDAFVISFDGLCEFELDFDRGEILITAIGDGVTENTIEHLIVDQIWPRVIAHSGDLVIHASAVVTEAGAILFTGPSGRGKSTLAASLHQRGHSLLGDDAIVIRQRGGRTVCEAVYPSLRLFPDSLATMFDVDVAQSAVAHYTEKQNVHLAATASEHGEHEVRAIFLIDGDEPLAQVSIAPLALSAACMKLVEHSFWLDPTDVGRTARKLHLASALAGSVPTYTLAYPRDFAWIPQVHAAIFAVLA